MIDDNDYPYAIGFDSCTIPGIVNINKKIIKETIEPCEAARFSCYISSELIMTPCSFDVEFKYGESLESKSIAEVWDSDKFDSFRNNHRYRCNGCLKRLDCMGGCPLMPEIILCNRNEKEIKVYEN